MEEGNEFVQQRNMEEKQSFNVKFQLLVQQVQDLTENLKRVYKEVRLTREDLRNKENLRPLKNKEEEEASTQVQGEVE